MNSRLPSRAPILPQAIDQTDPAKSLKLFQRFDRENNVLPLENWNECFRRRDACGPHEIVPGLYLGNIKTAAHYLLGFPQGEYTITHMLSIIQIGSTVRYNLPESRGEGNRIKRLTLNRRDRSSQNILQDFDQTSAFIHEAVQRYKDSEGKDGGVLVHCFAGVSRSASLVIAYLLKHPESIPAVVRARMLDVVQDTAQFVQSKREIVWPNYGFRRQLILYYDLLDCALTDEQTGRLKVDYIKWLQYRACNASMNVVATLEEFAAERRSRQNEP